MQIKKIAFGDCAEAFIEHRLTDGVNIIFSNENNKGKTLVVQAALYAIGNQPIFPTGFDYRKYYFYVVVEVQAVTYEFLRKNGTFVVRTRDRWQTFSSVSELKYFIDAQIFSLPRISKGGEEKIVDPELFYQLFFVGQDKRNSSTVQNAGYYNKTDFRNMLRSLGGCNDFQDSNVDVRATKQAIKEKKTMISSLRRKITLVKENPELAELTISDAERSAALKQQKVINDLQKQISDLRKKKSREASRKARLVKLLSELNSLNTKISVGKVRCGECGSEKIVYDSGDICFDLSNNAVRNNVISALHQQITMKGDAIGEAQREVGLLQATLARELEVTPVEQQHILIFMDDVVSQQEYSNEIESLRFEVDSLRSTLALTDQADENAKLKYNEMMELIISEMQGLYQLVDPHGRLRFSDIFSKHDDTYSGSEGQEFYFCRLLALNSYFDHSFPIVIDSFRSGELSTSKETKMIEIYKDLQKQVLLPSTLKEEEYDTVKYDTLDGVNAIDYSSHQNSKILQPEYAGQFEAVLESFGVLDESV